MDHPEVKNIMQTGYPSHMQEPRIVGVDSLGVEVYEGYELYVLGDEMYVKEELSYDAIEILEKHGATLWIAK